MHGLKIQQKKIKSNILYRLEKKKKREKKKEKYVSMTIIHHPFTPKQHSMEFKFIN